MKLSPVEPLGFKPAEAPGKLGRNPPPSCESR